MATEARAIESRLSQLGAYRTAERMDRPGREETTVDTTIRREMLALERIRAAQRADARQAGILGMPKSIEAKGAQDRLKPGSAMLTYVLGDERSHLLVLTRDRLAAFALAPRQVLEDHAEAIYEALRLSRDDEHQWRLAAESVGRLLLPAGAIPPGIERLLINAEGSLLYVPFGALMTTALPPAPSELRLLADTFDIVGIPSAAVWAALRERHDNRLERPTHVAIFSDPVFSANDLRLTHSLDADVMSVQDTTARARGVQIERLPKGPLPRLPATAREAKAILGLVSQGNNLDRRAFEANKRTVLDANLWPYSIIHFATHAWIDERLPELSGLILSRFDQEGHKVDGALYLHEIDRLRLAADLTVLSGCQTALGKHVRGDGLIGLTQGFFRAGSSQVLVSLWSLDDDAAATFMEAFYGFMLREGDAPARALRRAQRWMRAHTEYHAPRYWAPFVLQGTG